MRYVLLVVVAGLMWGIAAARAQSPSNAELHQKFERIHTELQAAHLDQALAMLRSLDQRKLNPAVAHQARLMLNALTGTNYAARLEPFYSRKVIDTVVLVDDEITLLRAVAAWPSDAFYPVLIDDGWYSRLFTQAFKPKHIVHLTSGLVLDPQIAHSAVTDEINRQNDRLDRTREVHPPNWAPPPGLVLIDPNDTQRVAGIALAIARRQPILSITGVKDPHDNVTDDYINGLIKQIAAATNYWRLNQKDTWTALTLAARLPMAYHTPETELPGPMWIKLKGPRALDDLLGRDSGGVRFAAAGRLIGDAAQANYQAMCALFLQPRDMLLVDDYSNRKNKPAWSVYSLKDVAPLLGHRFAVTDLANPRLSLESLRSTVLPKNSYDFVWINSSGGPAYFNIDAHNATADDVPIGRAAPFYFVHSMSAADPYDPDTIAGRALVGGAYWYAGSISEPYLSSFVEPESLTCQTLAGTPLAFAVRHLPGHPFAMPWKIIVIGDPLFTFRPKPAERIDRALPIGGDVPVQLDKTTLDKPDDLSPGQFAAAVFDRYANNDARTIIQFDPVIARRHPIAVVCYRICAAQQFAREINLDNIDAARLSLTHLLLLGGNTQTLTDMAKRYLMAMAKLGHRDAALTYLRALSDQNLPASAKQALEPLLK